MNTKTKTTSSPDAQCTESPVEKEITTAQIHVPLLDKLRLIRQRRGVTIPEAFDLYAGPAIDREYRKVLHEMVQEAG